MTTEQEFLNELDRTLWTSANKLLPSLDAAVYKHVILGLVFLKYVSDAFEERQEELRGHFTSPEHDYYLPREDYDSDAAWQDAVAAELEQRDYYAEKNVFWVPVEARWQSLRDSAKIPSGAELPWMRADGTPERMRNVGWLLDNAMEAIERENPKLKNVLNKDYARLQVDGDKLGELIDLFSRANFHAKEHNGNPLNLKGKDILGHVYEYFLGQFALAEGKKGGQYYTPKTIVSLIVHMLRPFRGRVFDPAMGSGGFFVQSEEFVEEFGGKLGQISVYGQESNPTTWRLAAMNMAIRGIEFDFGEGPADSFNADQHPDLRADFVMANPPFNMKEWWNAKLENDPRWQFGTPPQNNANFAWIQHMLYHLAPGGSMALLLANGSMSSSTGGDGEIRTALVEHDLVECMLALPGQMFTNTQIPACIWFLTRMKAAREVDGRQFADRRRQFLFIDARQMGYMKDRVLRDFTREDIQRIARTFHEWQQGEGYEDVPGFCKSATLEEVRVHEHVLTPGRYVGAKDIESDDEPFGEKMVRLTGILQEQFAEGARLDERIRENLAACGYAV
ncbi:MAG TPA: class I SAM-dependent DNA methyltransferase [Longimicrobium sp.]|jgi:type I restriction enzyme M protein